MNPYAKRIESLLSPVIGDFMARMTLRSQCQPLGITPNEIGAQHLESLAREIGASLRFHGHDAIANRVSHRIRMMKENGFSKI